MIEVFFHKKHLRWQRFRRVWWRIMGTTDWWKVSGLLLIGLAIYVSCLLGYVVYLRLS